LTAGQTAFDRRSNGRFPSPLEFNPDDPVHMDFVLAAANLKAQVKYWSNTGQILAKYC
jgi:hypothetical protein